MEKTPLFGDSDNKKAAYIKLDTHGFHRHVKRSLRKTVSTGDCSSLLGVCRHVKQAVRKTFSADGHRRISWVYKANDIVAFLLLLLTILVSYM